MRWLVSSGFCSPVVSPSCVVSFEVARGLGPPVNNLCPSAFESLGPPVKSLCLFVFESLGPSVKSLCLFVFESLGPSSCSHIPICSLCDRLYLLCFLDLLSLFCFSSSVCFSCSVSRVVVVVVSVFFASIFVKCFFRRPYDRLPDPSAARAVSQNQMNSLQPSFSLDFVLFPIPF